MNRFNDKLAGLTDRIAVATRTRVPAGTPAGDRLRAIRRRLPRRRPERPIGQVIFEYARDHPRAFVVQVGAHDGTAIDPLRDELLSRPWRGILVEPVPYVFERLHANYGRNPRLILENSAIAAIDGTMDFYHLPQTDPGAVWKWYDALGSFRKEVVLSHSELIPDIAERIVTTPVPCMTFSSLCRKHAVDHIDVIQIDTEGYDLEVLRLIDFDRWHPDVVLYEHIHLGRDGQAEARALLDGHGYSCMTDNMDTLAVRGPALDRSPRLGALWARLENTRSGGDT